jgi:hypothetical protein
MPLSAARCNKVSAPATSVTSAELIQEFVA